MPPSCRWLPIVRARHEDRAMAEELSWSRQLELLVPLLQKTPCPTGHQSMIDRILLTGATGFLGRHTRTVLEARYGREKVVATSSADFDLMDPSAVRRMFDELRPDAVVHLAAYSG